MPTIDTKKPVLLTGGGGYIASWIAKQLLEDGRHVRATVRNPQDRSKNAHLMALAEGTPGKLELYAADLTVEGSFQTAMDGCELVLHTASPFFIDGIKDPQKQLVEPALQGTRNVLNSVNAVASVKRVVLTSSVAAIMGDAIEARQKADQTFTEQDWNTSSSLSNNPYPYSKVLAERAAWEMAEAQSRWDLVVINPAFVLGPSLSGRSDSTSDNFMRSMVGGQYRTGAPDLYFGIVDVRDVARAHILAGMTSEAKGRHILCADTLSFAQIADAVRSEFPSTPLPNRKAPKFLLYFIGPFFGLSWSYINNNIGHSYRLDNSYSKSNLGIRYRPVSETLCDHAREILNSSGA